MFSSLWSGGRPTPYPQPSPQLLSWKARIWHELWYSDRGVPPLVWITLTASMYGVAGAVRRRYRPIRGRLKSSDYVTPDAYGHWLKGYVTAVGDADGFRFCHAPGWFGFYGLSFTEQSQTLSIRLAGIDAPEGGHPKYVEAKPQPYYAESLGWLKEQILDQTVYVKPLQKDIYGRIIAEVRKSPLAGKTISEEMLSAGWAHVYVQSNAVYGDPGHNKMNKKLFLKLVTEAQEERKGMWQDTRKPPEHPAEYKKRHAAAAAIRALPISVQSRLIRDHLVLGPRVAGTKRQTAKLAYIASKATEKKKTEARKRVSKK